MWALALEAIEGRGGGRFGLHRAELLTRVGRCLLLNSCAAQAAPLLKLAEDGLRSRMVEKDPDRLECASFLAVAEYWSGGVGAAEGI
ncbi:MAG: hypothetical protein LBQ12_11925 [Deltaproteobacteria bacterium]|nr:hypothetical protein [Deltaproteobacteria bacterium]